VAKNKKIPKKIAGVKVPKDLRKTGNKLAKLAKDPLVQEIALAAVAAGLAAREDTRKKAKQKAVEAGSDAAESAGWVSAAIGAAAAEAGRRVAQAIEEKGGKGKLGKAIKAVEIVAGGGAKH
jgi:hypothetical protein